MSLIDDMRRAQETTSRGRPRTPAPRDGTSRIEKFRDTGSLDLTALTGSKPGGRPLGPRQVAREGSNIPYNENSASALPGMRSRWGAPRSVPQFSGPVTGLAKGSLLDKWDAKGNIGGSETTTYAQDQAQDQAQGRAQAKSRASGYDPGFDYTGVEGSGDFKDALAMGAGSQDLVQPALIASAANRMQDEAALEEQRRMDEELYGVNING